jgi:Tfp pilus assembly protein PilF
MFSDGNNLFKAALLLVIFPLLTPLSVLAQRDRDSWLGGPTTEVSGQVRFADGGEPAKNIQVRLDRFAGGIIDQIATDSVGRFRFSGLQRGIYTITVSAPGYISSQQQADLQVVLRSYLVFELAPEKVTSSARTSVVDARVPAEAQAEFEKARIELANRKPDKAIPHLERAVTVAPDYTDAQLLLGQSLSDIKEWKRAEQVLQQVLTSNPKSVDALVTMGEMYRRQKRFGDAEKMLHDAIARDPSSWAAHFTLARVFWEQDDVRHAAPEVGLALQAKPDLAEAHLLAGSILLKLNEPARAAVEFQEYLKLAPNGEFASQARDLLKRIEKAGGGARR